MTKLKLDKDFGGGFFFFGIAILCCMNDVRFKIQVLDSKTPRAVLELFLRNACDNTYPYAWTVNFEMCLEMQLRTYQPPIPKTSQASAWCYRYIGRWMCKTEGSPTGLGENFGRLNG